MYSTIKLSEVVTALRKQHPERDVESFVEELMDLALSSKINMVHILDFVVDRSFILITDNKTKIAHSFHTDFYRAKQVLETLPKTYTLVPVTRSDSSWRHL